MRVRIPPSAFSHEKLIVSILLPLLAVVGVLAVGRFLVRSALGLARHTLEGYVLKTVADAQAQRGDLTALNEAKQLRRQQQTLRFRRWGEFLGLLALILVPPLTAYMLMIYAVYNVFWIPSLRSRASR